MATSPPAQRRPRWHYAIAFVAILAAVLVALASWQTIRDDGTTAVQPPAPNALRDVPVGMLNGTAILANAKDAPPGVSAEAVSGDSDYASGPFFEPVGDIVTVTADTPITAGAGLTVEMPVRGIPQDPNIYIAYSPWGGDGSWAIQDGHVSSTYSDDAGFTDKVEFHIGMPGFYQALTYDKAEAAKTVRGDLDTLLVPGFIADDAPACDPAPAGKDVYDVSFPANDALHHCFGYYDGVPVLKVVNRLISPITAQFNGLAFLHASTPGTAIPAAPVDIPPSLVAKDHIMLYPHVVMTFRIDGVTNGSKPAFSTQLDPAAAKVRAMESLISATHSLAAAADLIPYNDVKSWELDRQLLANQACADKVNEPNGDAPFMHVIGACFTTDLLEPSYGGGTMPLVQALHAFAFTEHQQFVDALYANRGSTALSATLERSAPTALTPYVATWSNDRDRVSLVVRADGTATYERNLSPEECGHATKRCRLVGHMNVEVQEDNDVRGTFAGIVRTSLPEYKPVSNPADPIMGLPRLHDEATLLIGAGGELRLMGPNGLDQVLCSGATALDVCV